ncbi:hypothetical protein [Niabella drilacis]|uniref:Uncharacterized protein n=1 Tax=Niabella drilacis (strain DSM 25811 / CCM 8410 / CCUG 62505 / LMG 26954 / E90) TaxID=1285928 RepID=A0A1G6LEW3_NIADE|nr:hypothetical protein [Niabella drilacis]SDC41723.1 hypothetical protein SAMN04487894_102323 [Niabella drilacis]
MNICVIHEEYTKEMVIASQGHSSAAQRKIKASGMAIMTPMSMLQKQDRGKAFNQACNTDCIGSAQP